MYGAKRLRIAVIYLTFEAAGRENQFVPVILRSGDAVFEGS
jgi:hypothetical protein